VSSTAPALAFIGRFRSMWNFLTAHGASISIRTNATCAAAATAIVDKRLGR